MFRYVVDYVGACIPCNQRNLTKSKPPLQETKMATYPWAKVSLDLSGPYPQSASGNKYIVAFVDWYSGWPEAFPTTDKSAATISSLLLEEIFPRFGCCLSLVTDNGTENINKVMKDILKTLKIHHITTSTYHPQSNSKVERFHRTLHDVLAKRINENYNTWDTHLNQTLGALRFSHSESTGYSPYFLLYGRDVVLPIDNILKPRQFYMGEDQHLLNLQNQHSTFVRVYKNQNKAKQRHAKYANINSNNIKFKVGDPVYLKKHKRLSKLSNKWEAFYRIIEQLSPRTFRLKSQLTGKIIESHAEHLRSAKLGWNRSKLGRSKLRAARMVESLSDRTSSSYDESSVGSDRDHSDIDVTSDALV